METSLPEAEKLKIKLPNDALLKSGHVYILLRGIDDIYYPVGIKTKYFNKTDFNLFSNIKNNISKSNIATNINNAVSHLIDAAIEFNQEAKTKAVKELNENVYVGELMFSIESSESLMNDGIEDIPFETQYKIVINKIDNAKERVRIVVGTKSSLKMTINADLTASSHTGDIVYRDKQTLSNEIISALYKFNLPLQINASKLKDRDYINDIINADILETNLISPIIANN
jgi:hypothetical protein